MSRPFTGAILTRVQPARTLDGGRVGMEGEGRVGGKEGAKVGYEGKSMRREG